MVADVALAFSVKLYSLSSEEVIEPFWSLSSSVPAASRKRRRLMVFELAPVSFTASDAPVSVASNSETEAANVPSWNDVPFTNATFLACTSRVPAAVVTDSAPLSEICCAPLAGTTGERTVMMPAD